MLLENQTHREAYVLVCIKKRIPNV